MTEADGRSSTQRFRRSVGGPVCCYPVPYMEPAERYTHRYRSFVTAQYKTVVCFLLGISPASEV